MSYDFFLGPHINGVGLQSALDNMHVPLGRLAREQVANVRRAFRSGGNAIRGGDQWAPWSKRYAADRAKRGKTHILVDTGRLRASIRGRVRHDSIVLQTPVEYADYHQFGTRHMPARPFLVFTRRDRSHFAARMAHWFRRKVNG